jgi:hypothetical protein
MKNSKKTIEYYLCRNCCYLEDECSIAQWRICVDYSLNFVADMNKSMNQDNPLHKTITPLLSD